MSLSPLSNSKDNDEVCAIQRANAIVDILNFYAIYSAQSEREIINNLCTF